jgi:hypothetical protein
MPCRRWNSKGFTAAFGHQAHGRQGVGVVGGELGVELGRGGDQPTGADQVGKIGRRLGGVDGVAGPAGHLGALDLAIPVGALDQPDHQPPAAVPGQGGDGVDHRRAALLVGLHRQAQAPPTAERRLSGQPVEQLQRQHQAVGLLGVDGEVEVVAGGDLRQPQGARIELVPHSRLMGRLVAWRQGRELHRNAVPGLGTGALGRAADGLDGGRVGGLVADGVGGGAGALAEHVERAQIAFRGRALERRLDVAAEHELLAHDPYGLARRPRGSPARLAGRRCLRRKLGRSLTAPRRRRRPAFRSASAQASRR